MVHETQFYVNHASHLQKQILREPSVADTGRKIYLRLFEKAEEW